MCSRSATLRAFSLASKRFKRRAESRDFMSDTLYTIRTPAKHRSKLRADREALGARAHMPRRTFLMSGSGEAANRSPVHSSSFFFSPYYAEQHLNCSEFKSCADISVL
jgi:hypothetical protein